MSMRVPLLVVVLLVAGAAAALGDWSGGLRSPALAAESAALVAPRSGPASWRTRTYFPLITAESATPPAPIWPIEQVDAADGAAAQPALALDSAGQPYITYYFCYASQPRDCELKLAHRTGAIWATSVVDANPGLSGPSLGGPSIALDASNRPHISYYHHGASGSYIVYARWTGENWDSQRVDDADFVGPATSLAVDTTNKPHIAFYDRALDQIRYAEWTGSAWQIQIVAAGVGAGTELSLALDTAGNAHIVYWEHHPPSFWLQYAVRATDGWRYVTVDKSDRSSVAPSLALDTSGNPHVSYAAYANASGSYAPLYARRTDGTWYLVSIGAHTQEIRATSLALDSIGNPHVGYDRTLDGRQTVMYSRLVGASWSQEALDPDAAWGISLALDRLDRPHIAYEGGPDYGLRFTERMMQ
jgi:hypothetical protein